MLKKAPDCCGAVAAAAATATAALTEAERDLFAFLERAAKDGNEERRRRSIADGSP